MESCFLVISFLFAFGLSSGERTLKFVTVLYRHGDRSPVMAYPADPYKESDWPQGFGQLSREGMKQHFELGQFLKKRYTGFLSESYDRHEIFIRSTDADRTLMSAEANLAGMFPPNGSEMFNPDLKWQPIPVHTVPEDQDKLLSFPLKDCPRYSQLRNETEKTNIFLNMTETYKGFLEMVRNKTGLEKPNIGNIWSLYDTLFCEAKHGMRPPDWVTPSVMETLKVLNNFGYQILFGVYKKKEKCRLQGGLLLDQIIKNLSNAAAPDSKQKVKMMVYSAHDTTVVALQEALNVFNGLQPPYASCHLIELHQEENGMFTVEMFYRNDTDVSEPYPVSLPGCSQRCSLQDFVKLTREVIPQDRDKECQIRKEATDKGAAAGEKDILEEEGGTKEEEEQNREAEVRIRQPSPEGPDGAKLPSECCFNLYGRKLPIAKIDSYIETSVECTKPGVIFVTKKGSRICVDPQLSWVKSAMKAVDERDLYKKK